MKLEYSILEHLNNNDNGKLVDVTFIEEDYAALKRSLDELKGKNMILIDEHTGRDFEAFGIGNNRKKLIKAKIKMNGRIRFQALNSKKRTSASSDHKKDLWSLSYFF